MRDTSWAEVLPELIWILKSFSLIWILNFFSSVSLSSFQELLSLSLSYAFRQLKLKIQISSDWLKLEGWLGPCL